MKFVPKKVFIKENDEYVEIEYDEFCKMKANNAAIKKKHFILVQGYLLEVDEKYYQEYYREKEREKYLRILDIKNQHTSISAMLQYHNEEDFSYIEAGPEYDVESLIIDKIIIEELREILSTISKEENQIIDLVYNKQMTQRKAAKELGIAQSTLEYRLKKLISRIRTLLSEFA